MAAPIRQWSPMPKIVCDWGLPGIEAWKDRASTFVIVDVLSFSTAVSVAVERGAKVIPFPYGDPDAAAAEAASRNAVAASPRSAGGGQFSLSPASLKRIAPGSRLLLPSPNGARLSLATGDTATICGCLRNARAIAKLVGNMADEGTVAVIVAGERLPDGTQRPAIEDWLGAGAIIAASGARPDSNGRRAARAYQAAKVNIGDAVRGSTSGRELTDAGYGDDVEVALELDSTTVVPILRRGEYEPA